MTILVDEARWPWRGTIWCHLVSDSNYGELHEFAARLGCRRVGFQGDHYDIEVRDRDRALDAGAEAVESGELVRRLRRAGLRDRTAKPRWVERGRWPVGEAPDGLPSSLRPLLEPLDVDLRAALGVWLRIDGDGGEVDRLDVLVVDLAPHVEVGVAEAPFATGRRADGSWTIEIFSADPAPWRR